MDLITVNDIVKLAVLMEINSEAFYTNASNKNISDRVRKIFREFAAQEKKHTGTFKRAFKALKIENVGAVNMLDKYKSDFDLLKRSTGEAIAEKINSEIDAVELALGLERNAVLFYTKMKEDIDENKELDFIIAQEKGHVRALMALKEKLQKRG